MTISFRHSAGFGKRIEYWLAGLMLKQGIDVYLPMVDDDAIDAVIKCPDGRFIQIQIKARSKDVNPGDGALFAGITHTRRSDYYFVFYSERHDKVWILSSEEFLKHSYENKAGDNIGKRSIWLNGKRKNKNTGEITEHIYPRFVHYEAIDFDLSRLLEPIDHCPESHSKT